MFIFDLQLFGGKGGGTTVNNVPASVPGATPEQRALERENLEYVRRLQPSANAFVDIAMDSLGIGKKQTGTRQVFDTESYLHDNPAVAERYSKGEILDVEAYARNALSNDSSSSGNKFLDTVLNKNGTPSTSNSLSKYVSEKPTYDYDLSKSKLINPDFNALGQQSNDRINNAMKNYDSTSSTTSGDYDALINNQHRATNYANKISDEIANDNRFNDLNAEYTPLLQKYQNGELPDIVKKNRYDYVSDMGNRQWGEKLNQLAANGIVDGTITQKALGDTNQNVTNALAQTYASDLNTMNNIANTNLASRVGLVKEDNGRKTQALGIMNGQNGIDSSNITNSQAYNNSILENNVNLSRIPMQNALMQQEAQLNTPLKLFGVATNQQAPSMSMWGTMAGNQFKMSSPSQTIVSQDSPGLFGGVLTGLASGIGGNTAGVFCFVAGTMIDIPDGEKTIEEFAIDDPVIAYDEIGNHEEKVYAVLTPHEADTVIISVDNGNVTTTPSQPFLTPLDGFIVVSKLSIGDEIIYRGEIVKINQINPGGKQLVYDLKVTGCNTYIANGFVAKGGDDEWA